MIFQRVVISQLRSVTDLELFIFFILNHEMFHLLLPSTVVNSTSTQSDESPFFQDTLREQLQECGQSHPGIFVDRVENPKNN